MKNVLCDVCITYCKTVRIDIDDVRTLSNRKLSTIVSKGTSMYYVSTKRGGRGSAKCLLLLTWGEGGSRGLLT